MERLWGLTIFIASAGLSRLTVFIDRGCICWLVVYPTGLEAVGAKSVAWLPLVKPLLWLALCETEGSGSHHL